MSSIVEIEKGALHLPERERATLAASLLDSLPSIISDKDEGIAEAFRRDEEIEANRAQTISLVELDNHIHVRVDEGPLTCSACHQKLAACSL